MQTTVKKVKNPLESISRRSVLGVMGVGMTGVLVGCNDDLSPLKLTLKSSATGEVTSVSEVMLTATVGVGMADTIEFYESNPSGDDTLLGSEPVTLSAATMPIKYTAADNGIHAYYTRATSLTGKEAPSNPVVVKVNIATAPVLPTISLTSSSTSVIVDGNVTLTAAVTGTTISQVEFFDGTTTLGVVSSAPYTKTITFTATNNGTHNYTAKVTDSSGNIATSTPAVVVTVNIPAALPTITLSASPTTVTAAGNVTLTAAITGGSFTQVEFFDGATSLGMGVVAGTSYTKTIPFTATAPAQTHNYTAKGTVADGRTVTSAPANVNVNIGNLAPTITLSSSSGNVVANGSITLTATATAKTGTISKVEFFDGATSLGVVTAPTAFTKTIAFTATNNGTHNYTAKATDSSGNSATSTPAVAVTVNIPATPPTITLTAAPSTVTAAGSATLTATVTAGTGTITKVEFFEGATLLGTDTTGPSYTFAPAYTSANNGTRNYTAKVTASDGSTATSTVASVTVNIATIPPTVTLTPLNTTVTAAGSVTLTATVTAGSGMITKVEFFEGTILLGTDTTGPSYTFVPAYTSTNNGTHTYTAKVTASDGSTATSTPVTVTVNIAVTAGTLIALYTALPAAGSYVNFNHPTSGIKCILYRAPTAQTGGVTNAGAFYVAYSRKCTHAGTIITNNPNTATPHILTCQDHKAQFNMDGNCAPLTTAETIAPSPLPSIVIKVGTDGIYI